MTNTLTIPNRLGRKRGRFSVDFETNEISAGLRAQTEDFGDVIAYYRFEGTDSVMDDIYDEGSGAGKKYNGPIPVEVLHVTHLDGGNENLDTGYYDNDELHVTIGFDAFTKTGMIEADIRHGQYQRDRIVYDGTVFRVNKIQVLGQIQERDIVISLDATEVKGDELVNDAQFAAFSD